MIRLTATPPTVANAAILDQAVRAQHAAASSAAQRRSRLALITPAPARFDLAPGDWDLLFRAVMDRLARIAAEPSDGPSVQPLPDAAGRLRGDVCEVLGALRQLHAWQCNAAARARMNG